MNSLTHNIEVRNTRLEDIGPIIELSIGVYPGAPPWTAAQLECHLSVFPEGQFVAIELTSGHVVGAAASLIVLWDDYNMQASWREFTDQGTFRNHNPMRGRTLYGAEVMVRPSLHGFGIGKALYRARRELAERLGLLRIRAGARLRGYHKFAGTLTPEEYVMKVVRGQIGDPTLSFQLRQGFQVLAVVRDYLRHDPESLGHAAVIEWINAQVASPEDYGWRDPRFEADAKTVVSGSDVTMA
ncbi:MAG: GNAT family N-acetyltransferase [Bryobacterales bacterium]|nr:GNAT family N-acetyltransferase [Bryobacterales bacterium]